MTLLLWLLLLLPTGTMAQSTRVRGTVTDAETGESLVGVSVLFRHSFVGISTDIDGAYALETRDSVSVLEFSLLGYEPQAVDIVPGSYNEVNVALEVSSMGIDAVVVVRGEDPAMPILRNVSRNKWRNDPQRMESYACRAYTKMELDLSNMRGSFKNKALQRNFGFVFDNVDTSAITGKPFLPVMITESSADLWHRRSPSLDREVIRASRISGIEEDYALSQFTGQLYADVNFYDNYIDLFNVRFAGPLSDHGSMYYDYYLVDSLRLDGRKIYRIRFHPKVSSVPVFDGEVNIDSATFALQSARVTMPRGVDVNWLRHLVLEAESRPLDDTLWFPSREKMFADFSLVRSDSSKMISFLGHREVSYSDVRVGVEIPREVERIDRNVTYDDDVLRNDESFWEEVRPYRLSEREKATYAMVDSIKQVPMFRNIYGVLEAVLGGYYETGKVGWGPYYKVFSFNRLEGARFQMGVRTTNDFSRKVRLSGYAAYGTKDSGVKGGGTVELMFNNRLKRKLTLSARHDALQLGSGVNAFSESNIMSSLFSRGNKTRLSIVDEAKADYSHEWVQGISTGVGASLRSISSNRYVPLLRSDSTEMGAVRSAAVGVSARLAFRETVLRRYFDSRSLGSKYPILSLHATFGLKGLLRNDFSYTRLEAGLSYRLDIPPLGSSHLTVEGGHIFGKVPYPLLKLHEGNGTYFYDKYAFSCMEYYEFASDSWVSFFYEHHFKGFFLGKIPLLRKLKWREVAVFKGVYGTLSEKNDGSLPYSEAILRFPQGLGSVRKPYFEAGVGIENIFKVFRVDAIWRLTHRDKIIDGDRVGRFTVNCSVELHF